MKILPFGVCISFEYCRKTNLQRFIIAIAGPITNLIIAGIFWFVPEFKDRAIIIYANLLICIFNLLPVYPLDGGRILKAVLGKFYEYNKADELVNKISNLSAIVITIFASIGVIVLKNMAIIFIVIYIWALVTEENRRYKVKKSVYKIIEDDRKKVKEMTE